jgi:alkylation response protein AidB-like acyl-CoA dehydrogenase
MNLERAETFLRERVAPFAAEMDGSPARLHQAMRDLGKAGLAALKVPAEYGGPDFPEADFRLFQQAAARASGTFAFLQTQHQSAASLVLKSHNEALMAEYLPGMVTGQKWLGIGFSQLRRPGPPVTRAEPGSGGYRLEGHVPWVTGAELYPEFLIGATLPDGQAVFGVCPLVPGPGIRFSEPMKLAAMESALTVTADLDGFFLAEDRVLFIKPADWIARNDQINITLQGHFAIGCARAGLDVLEANFLKRGHPFLNDVLQKLRHEWELCREAMNVSSPAEVSTPERLKLRAWAIDLAMRCAQAAVISSSGAANTLDHAAQRIYREALVFSVSAQTTAIMEASLARLIR